MQQLAAFYCLAPLPNLSVALFVRSGVQVLLLSCRTTPKKGLCIDVRKPLKIQGLGLCAMQQLAAVYCLALSYLSGALVNNELTKAWKGCCSFSSVVYFF